MNDGGEEEGRAEGQSEAEGEGQAGRGEEDQGRDLERSGDDGTMAKGDDAFGRTRAPHADGRDLEGDVDLHDGSRRALANERRIFGPPVRAGRPLLRASLQGLVDGDAVRGPGLHRL